MNYYRLKGEDSLRGTEMEGQVPYILEFLEDEDIRVSQEAEILHIFPEAFIYDEAQE